MYLIFHVISEDHLIEDSIEFMSESSWQYDTNLASLVTIGIVI